MESYFLPFPPPAAASTTTTTTAAATYHSLSIREQFIAGIATAVASGGSLTQSINQSIIAAEP